MKKFLVSFFTLALCLTVLSACSNEKNNDSWLQGKWYSKSWNIAYAFVKNNDTWKIEDSKGSIISESASQSEDSSDKGLTLVDKNGTQFVINKIDSSHMTFQQLSKEGLLGTTAAVEFVKK